MEFRILGPLEVEEDGKPLAPSGRRARALLALLLLHANERMSAERLVEEIWGDDAAANPLKTLQIHISRLRKSLGGERLETVGGGYALLVRAGELDRDRAASLVARGRERLDAGDPEEAGEAFRAALSLFRGRPLEEFVYEPFASVALGLLDELRLEAAEGLFDSQLAMGRGAHIIGEVEALVAEQPLRERLHEQRLLALYQAGRQADALAAYQDVRRRLVDEVGLEPGPALQALERKILHQDPSLSTDDRRGRSPLPRNEQRGRRRRAALVGSAVAVAGVALLGFAAWAFSQAEAALPARALAILDPETLAPAAVIQLGGTPSDIVVGRRAVFVSLPGHGTVVVVDPRTRAGASLGAPVRRPTRLAAGAGGLWVLDGNDRRVALLGSRRTFDVPAAPDRGPSAPLDAFATADRSLWLAERHAELVFRLDPSSGRAQSVDNRGPDSFFEGDARRAVAVTAGSVWLANPVSIYPATERLGRVSRIDAATGKLSASIRLPAPPIALAADDQAVWVALERGDSLWRIDPRDNVATAAVPVPGGVVDVAVGEGSAWTLGPEGDVTRIDPRTNEITARTELGRGGFIAAGHGAVWIAAR